MKKKLIYTGLLLGMFAFATACSSGNDADSKKADTEKTAEAEAEVTAEPTNTPLPTADVTVTKQDGVSVCENNTAGYKVSYKDDTLEMSNENETISFQAPNENAKDGKKTKKGENTYNKEGEAEDNSYMNVFVTITTSTDTSAKDFIKSFEKAYKKNSKKTTEKIGKNKTEATKFTISDENGTRHEIYVVDGKEKVWVVELKCAKSQKKEFDKTLTKVVDSLEFDQTVEKETTKEE